MMSELSAQSVQIVFAGIILLFGIGLIGLMITRNLIKIVILLQLMAKAAILGMALAGNVAGKPGLGQSLAVTVIVVDTVVAVIALALAVQVQKTWGTLDLKDLSTLRR
ncbi:MAG: NADH-quinone oxidoreductase subunit K [Chloroflexota bacterium]|jgi:NADH-quinone oxidoreductase subunit K|nr:NADH-quinone oxidoreductase subunit K [Chloroflexota bacterium]